jgi:hypothetical protein
VRTTVNLDDALLGSAKQAAAARGTTLTRLIEDALREALARPPVAQSERVELPTSGGGGLRAGVDLNDSAALRDLMDDL